MTTHLWYITGKLYVLDSVHIILPAVHQQWWQESFGLPCSVSQSETQPQKIMNSSTMEYGIACSHQYCI